MEKVPHLHVLHREYSRRRREVSVIVIVMVMAVKAYLRERDYHVPVDLCDEHGVYLAPLGRARYVLPVGGRLRESAAEHAALDLHVRQQAQYGAGVALADLREIYNPVCGRIRLASPSSGEVMGGADRGGLPVVCRSRGRRGTCSLRRIFRSGCGDSGPRRTNKCCR